MSAGGSWALVGLCAVVTAAIKATGPVALGGRELPAWCTRVIQLMAPALLSALVCVAVFSHGHRLALGPETAGVAAGALTLWRNAPLLVAVVVAAVVTAALRAL